MKQDYTTSSRLTALFGAFVVMLTTFMMTGLVAPTKAMAASGQMGPTVTLDNGAQFSVGVMSDGTGYGTASHCLLTKANGFTGVTDENANDGVVCSGDTIQMQLNFSVPATQNSTSYIVTYPNDPRFDMSALNSGWCTNDQQNRWQATKLGNGCRYTFAAGASITASFTATVPSLSGISNAPAPLLGTTVGIDGETGKTSLDFGTTLTVIQGVLFDTILKGTGSSSVATYNGTQYASYSENVVYRDLVDGSLGAPIIVPDGSTSKNGLLYTYTQGETSNTTLHWTLDLSSLPQGWVVVPTNTAYSASDLYDITSTSITTKSFAPGSDQQAAQESFNILVPLQSQPAAWDVGLKNVTTSLPNIDPTKITYPMMPFAENGDGQNSSWDSTTHPFGETPSLAKSNTANNDVTTLTYNPVVNPNGLVSKSTVLGIHKDNTVLQTLYYHEQEKFVATLGISSYPATTDEFDVCDSFHTVAMTNTNSVVPEALDTSTPIKVTQNGVALDPSTYEIDYGVYPESPAIGANAFAIECETSTTTMWSSTPSSKTNIIRIRLKKYDLSAGAGQILVPMMTDPKSYYYGYDTTIRSAYDYVAGSVVQNGTRTDATQTVQAMVNVGNAVPVVNVMPYALWYNPNSGFLQTVPANNNVQTYMGDEIQYSNADNPAVSSSSTDTYTLDSCVLNVTPSAALKPYIVSSTPPNYGPDGIPCTSDDVSGWSFTAKFPDQKGDTTNVNNGNVYNLTGLVAPWATSSTRLKETDAQTTVFTLADGSKVTITTPDTVNDYREASSLLPVTATQTVGQYKTVDYARRPAGSDIGWSLDFFSTQTAPTSAAEYIDVLPYTGDSLGTKLAAPLTNVRLATSNLPTGSTLYVTTADPKTIPTDVTNAAIDPSNSMWCVYGTDACPAGGNYTAIYLTVPSIPANTVFAVHPTVSTAGTIDKDQAVNQLGTQSVTGVGTILPSLKVTTVLYADSISGVVYNDKDKNSEYATDTDAPLNAYPVQLLDNQGNVIASTTTDTSGAYNFANLGDGSYQIRIQQPDGTWSYISQSWTDTNSSATDTNADNTSPTITLQDSSQANVNFGLVAVPTYTISGVVYDDKNANSAYNTGTDAPLNSYPVQLLDNQGNVIASSNTGIDGSYSFTKLLPGGYQVRIEQPDGTWSYISQSWTDKNASATDTNADNTSPTITITNADQANVNFGLVEVPGVNVSGRIYTDANDNGFHDTNEPNLSGEHVKLVDSTGTIIATTTTASDGTYTFTKVPSGSYTVTWTDEPKGVVLTQSYTTVDTDGSSTSTTVPVTVQKVDVTGIDYGVFTPVVVTTKKLGMTGAALTGAQFTVSPVGSSTFPGGSTTPQSMTADSSGSVFSTPGLLLTPARYQITETKAPLGYNLLAQSIVFEVDATGKVTIISGFTSLTKVSTDNPSNVEVTDTTPISNLPQAGGDGADGTMLLASLSSIVLAVGAVKARQRRQRKQN